MPLDHSSGGGGSGALNVLGTPLSTCGSDPITGFFRDGCCNTREDDQGVHTICAIMTDEFLAFSQSRGNDLSTPMPFFEFPGLKAGDRWCLCASRWLDAYKANCAPRVVLGATHKRTLDIVPLEALKAYAIDN
jgi:uncharacterized protein (DUF2237 family)